ncbi:signal peptidase II [Erythrobacter insulae]|uniref:Lipoprotein signal peptidase n=1 Tax=Erythrobacter insulae TaxID=2584124 RepID=A0A547PBC9_9SPHN|nr:signal peptidase II [Erythrobacter insulae]TRD11447.1 signal peptidase II [Erythrobacter insulae]
MSGLFTRNRLIGLAFAAMIAIVDQAIKAYVTVTLGINTIGDKMDLLPFFDLTYTENRGISLGMLQATNMEMRWLLVLMTAAIALIVFIWMLREKLMGDILGLAMILGGAIGNIYDRYTFGYVIDFADFHIGDFRPFLIFNVADAAITIGVVIILARSLFMGEKDDNEMDAASVPSEN